MKKINWKLISDIAVIISMTAVIIGFIVFANKLNEYKERIKKLELQYRLIEQDLEEKYEIDPGIKNIK
jgi:hypothetical protein